MKANCWFGKHDMRVVEVPDPEIINPHDAIVKITSTAICGSDLHIYDGFIPAMEKGDIVGHEFMGEVVEIGSEVKKTQSGRSDCGAVCNFVRAMFLLPERPVLPL